MSKLDESSVERELTCGVTTPRHTMTEDEFVAWCDEDVKAEWVEGDVIVIPPANRRHAAVGGFLYRVAGDYTDEHDLGLVFGPECTVRLAALRRRRVPDLFFILKDRLNLLELGHFEGPPDLVMEIVSPDSQARDWRDKYLDYQAAGVRESWIIDPISERAEAYALDSEGAFRRVAEQDGKLASKVLPGFFLKPGWLWQAQLPRVRDVLRELGLSW